MMWRISMVGPANKTFEKTGVRLMNFSSRARTQKDVKNEGCSLWLIENKGAKKVLPMVD
jgi:hypothetical protein